MQITFNNQPIEVNSDCTLLQLLVQQNLSDKQGIAVAVNNQVIPRAQWPHCRLLFNQVVVVFTAAQGG
jgi:sulfur carrier protein